MGSNPAPGIRLVIVGAGANRERALASSGILPEEANETITQCWTIYRCYSFYNFTITLVFKNVINNNESIYQILTKKQIRI